MRRARKTVAEKNAEQEAATQRAWSNFQKKLSSVETVLQVLELYGQAPPVDSSGRKFYSNLGNFLLTFSAPAGASATELREYLRVIKIYDEEGMLKPGVREATEARLSHALKADRF
ncbi:MAG: hypothetical protein ABIY70_09020 [Capsulimonas sp.]|uniref:hypothetical protein n=1 Tax=Capsulimonas sp. TaxID=2494211 RepID=UPI0032656017